MSTWTRQMIVDGAPGEVLAILSAEVQRTTDKVPA